MIIKMRGRGTVKEIREKGLMSTLEEINIFDEGVSLDACSFETCN